MNRNLRTTKVNLTEIQPTSGSAIQVALKSLHSKHMQIEEKDSELTRFNRISTSILFKRKGRSTKRGACTNLMKAQLNSLYTPIKVQPNPLRRKESAK